MGLSMNIWQNIIALYIHSGNRGCDRVICSQGMLKFPWHR